MIRSLANYQPSTKLFLDTVHLSSRDFDATNLIDENWDYLTYSQRARPASTFLYPSGHYSDPATSIYVRLQRRRISLQFSAPRVIYGRNTKPINKSDMTVIRHHIDRIGGYLGVRFSTEALIPTRIDLFKDFELNFSVNEAIADLWRLTRFDHLKLVFESTAHDWSYVRWANKNRQAVAYDKSREALEKGLSLPSNLLRFEYRLMNTNTCCRTGFHSIGSLSDRNLQRNVLNRILNTMVAEADAVLCSISRTTGGFIQHFTDVALSSRASELPVLIAGALGGEKLLELFGGEHGIERYLDSLSLESHKRASIKKQIRRILKYRQTTSQGTGVWETLRPVAIRRSVA